jgi:3-phosphoglycerate kinase
VRTCNVHEVAADEMILDVGPAAVEALSDVLKTCKTLVWNGPLGAFETEPFDTATVALARTAAALTKEGSLTSVAGGGRYGRGAQSCGRWQTISALFRPLAAPSSNGWKARNCRV